MDDEGDRPAEMKLHQVTWVTDAEESEEEQTPEERAENARLRRYALRNRYDPRVLDLIEEQKELPEGESTPSAARNEEYEMELDSRYLNDMREGRKEVVRN